MYSLLFSELNLDRRRVSIVSIWDLLWSRHYFIAQNVTKRELELEKNEASLNSDSRYIIIQQLSNLILLLAL